MSTQLGKYYYILKLICWFATSILQIENYLDNWLNEITFIFDDLVHTSRPKRSVDSCIRYVFCLHIETCVLVMLSNSGGNTKLNDNMYWCIGAYRAIAAPKLTDCGKKSIVIVVIPVFVIYLNDNWNVTWKMWCYFIVQHANITTVFRALNKNKTIIGSLLE